MSRLSGLEKAQLDPEFTALVEKAEATGDYINATRFKILGHRPDMFKSFFQFYRPAHESGVVDVVLKELVRLKIAQLNSCKT